MSTLKAILGPTNTGKTHYALERMMGHGTGMIGLPLRLLAREVYDRVVNAKGARAVALITGEERIVPDAPRYWICTVEAMPQDQQVDCLVVDEIQLAEHEDRGHVFTDRILHARGVHETLLLGAETMREPLRQLDFDIDTDVRERFSELSYAGPRKITKLPKRTAIVAFSADQVYAIAEVLRRQKGGSAVVMGGLSPRTRNAQVALYQSGEVDYLVATDAIGMGLNLDVDQIAFAGRTKFDGRRHRALSPSECGQIAGRAGRFRDDGAFGETGDCPPFEPELVHAIEEHRYESVAELQWRNSDLDYRSIRTLIASLAYKSNHPVLRQDVHGLDEWILRRMAEDASVGPDVRGVQNVKRLWDLARLPDFRKAGHEGHGRLILGLAETLANPDARLGDAGMEKRIAELDNVHGDISTLQQRLAMIRTWTYAAFRPDWLEHPTVWQEKTRQVEDRLSDALHDALTQRFVDRRTTALMAGLKREDVLTTELSDTGDVVIEGHAVGRLVGLAFVPDTMASTLEGRTVRNAALTALVPVIADRLKSIAGAPETAFSINTSAEIIWQDAPVARLVAGPHWLAPSADLIGGDGAETHQQDAARNRLNEWLGSEIQKRLPTHFKLKFLPDQSPLEGLARGLAFRLLESGAAADLRDEDRALHPGPEDRVKLKEAGIRSGRIAAHIPDAQKPAGQRLIAILHALSDGRVRAVAPEGAGSFELDGTWPDEDLAAQGYLRFGKRAVRADLAERLGWELSKRRKEAGQSQFEVPPDLASIVSCPLDDFGAILKGFGVVPAARDGESGSVTHWRFQSRARLEEQRQQKTNRQKAQNGSGPTKARSGKPPHKRGKPQQRHRGPARSTERKPDPNSPFAALAALLPPEPEKPAGKPNKKKRRKSGKSKPKSQDMQVVAESPPDTVTGSGSEPSSIPPASQTDTPSVPEQAGDKPNANSTDA
ncbi:MAG: helicase-related protein [Pseudomonadota bacterium]